MKRLTGLSVLLIICLFAAMAAAKPKHQFKIASLAPEGSIWTNKFNDFAREVEDKTGGEVGFRVYPGGVMGDDIAMYRKMRAGQLHGGGFTMTGIASIVPDFGLLSIPFLLNTYEEADAAVEALKPYWAEKFSAKGMEFIELTEVGFIYPMSTKKISTVSELKATKSWVPAGDKLAGGYLNNIGISPIQLGIPDVLSSLQTGLIDTVYNSLYGSIVMQWFTKANYVTDAPFGYAYGVFLMSKKAFKKLNTEQQEIVRRSADTHFTELLELTRKSNRESRDVLSNQGVQFIEADPVSVEELAEYREKTVADQMGKTFSKEGYEVLKSALNEHRGTETAQ